MRKLMIIVTALAMLGLAAGAMAADRLRLATTTSTEATGLLDVLLPPFERANSVKVDVLSVGTGKALALARRCDVDVVMVHAPGLEKQFVEQGYGIKRVPLMHNYFVIIGPAGDPAGVKNAKTAPEALAQIKKSGAKFLSRGDNSGTNVKELALWKAAGVEPQWPGYLEAGQGMGRVLTMAQNMKAYTLSDIGTYTKYKSLGRLDLPVLFTGDDSLKNFYSVIVVSPEKCPKTDATMAEAFQDYLVSPQGQGVIGGFKADGKQMFWPNAEQQ